MARIARESAARTRRAMIERLKQDGPQDAGTLAAGLGVSAMAVRQHLYALAEEKLVTFNEEARPVGRPAKLWRLTEAADWAPCARRSATKAWRNSWPLAPPNRSRPTASG